MGKTAKKLEKSNLDNAAKRMESLTIRAATNQCEGIAQTFTTELMFDFFGNIPILFRIFPSNLVFPYLIWKFAFLRWSTREALHSRMILSNTESLAQKILNDTDSDVEKLLTEAKQQYHSFASKFIKQWFTALFWSSFFMFITPLYAKSNADDEALTDLKLTIFFAAISQILRTLLVARSKNNQRMQLEKIRKGNLNSLNNVICGIFTNLDLQWDEVQESKDVLGYTLLVKQHNVNTAHATIPSNYFLDNLEHILKAYLPKNTFIQQCGSGITVLTFEDLACDTATMNPLLITRLQKCAQLHLQQHILLEKLKKNFVGDISLDYDVEENIFKILIPFNTQDSNRLTTFLAAHPQFSFASMNDTMLTITTEPETIDVIDEFILQAKQCVSRPPSNLKADSIFDSTAETEQQSAPTEHQENVGWLGSFGRGIANIFASTSENVVSGVNSLRFFGQTLSWLNGNLLVNNADITTVEDNPHYHFFIKRDTLTNCSDDTLQRFIGQRKHFVTTQSATGLKRITNIGNVTVSINGVENRYPITHELKLLGANGTHRLLCCEIPADNSSRDKLLLACIYLSDGLHTKAAKDALTQSLLSKTIIIDNASQPGSAIPH
jgi:hypothetical protein